MAESPERIPPNYPDGIQAAQAWYENSYGTEGFGAQRLYPNEELLRFFGRNLFGLDRQTRAAISVLEVGCGSCSNLWIIAREGFDTYGIDLSAAAIALGEKMLAYWGTKAQLTVGSMTQLPYSDARFDVVCDVLASPCLDHPNFQLFLKEAHRVLKPGGQLFIYAPSTASDAFIDFAPAEKIDEFTLNGIYRRDAPFYGNFYPFHFIDSSLISAQISLFNFKVKRLELVTKTYNDMTENLQFVCLEATKEAG